jgi:hypothetical protein
MGCLLLLVGLVFPRLALVLLFLFTNWVGRAFEGGLLIPLLGVLFLPYTALWYTVVEVHYAVWGPWQIGLLVLAVLADLSSFGGAARRRR